MEELRRFDVATYGDVAMVVIESELLPPDPAVVVVPLLANYPAIRLLNPVLDIDGVPLVLATRLIGAVRRNALRRSGSALAHQAEITRALDILMAGV